MHIKQVIICGFRSYKDQIVVEPFSKSHNVVIGRNGTGKSNFFDAIRFGLLTSRFANLRQEERQSLLHEGSGKHVMSAYVEIIFDNEDGRFPIEADEVVLRRTIGVKKDEFFLNRKHIPKSDVIHLLESAGFSRSNPYYIVQQGKVNALALMKDQDRLELLKEVAGTRTYDDSRNESLQILQETNGRREKIEEVIKYIEERLSELEEEKDELKAYQELDKQKRALEYTLREKELDSIRAELELIERSRMEAIHSTELHDQAKALDDEIHALQSSIEELTQQSEAERSGVARLEEERTGVIQSRFQIELEVNELRDLVRADADKHENLATELRELQSKIKELQTELARHVLPQFQIEEEKRQMIEKQLSEVKKGKEQLVTKQTRKSQFSSQKERDAFLKTEISEVGQLIERKQKETSQLNSTIAKLKETTEEMKQEAQEQREDLQESKQALDSAMKQIQQFKQKRNDLAEERKEQWRKENELSKDSDQLHQRVRTAEDALYSTMSADVRRGLRAIEQLKTSYRPGQIYGPLIELVEPADDRFCTAMDEAGGGALFHVVVATDDVAAQLMRELDKKNLGRLTFLPLNRLKIDRDPSTYPRNDDAMPLLDHLKYSAEVEKAVISTFGKKLLCRDLHTCSLYAESAQMDCLTLDGDYIHRRGGMNGGYKDPLRSRVRAMQTLRQARADLAELDAQLPKLQSVVQTLDQQVANAMSELQKQEHEKERLKESYSYLQKQHKRLEKAIEVNDKNLTTKEQFQKEFTAQIADFEAKYSTLKSELETPMQEALTQEEQERLRALTEQIEHYQHLLDDNSEYTALSLKKTSLENVLHQNLLLRQTEIQKQLESSSALDMNVTEHQQNLESKELDLEQATKLVEDNTTELAKLQTLLATSETTITTHQSRQEQLKQQSATIKEQIRQQAVDAEKILNKRILLIAKREDAMANIREVGTLSMKEVEKYQLQGLSINQLSRKLAHCNDRLQEYSHVNKKALDQYLSFNEQRSALHVRQEEIDQALESIRGLIDVLDQRKDEAIMRTFKGVSHHFKQVFQELVPTGEGKMVIIRRDPAESSSGSSSTDNRTNPATTLETFTGIQIKVSFRGEGDSYLMQQLSGGQKALVALAFIFAIQRCDPAPFYLFDEIDQALDSTHRAAVSALIHRQAHSDANPAQFITSTFRPEMVNVADQFYGIGHQNKVSDVHVLTKDASLEFISNIMAEEEGVAKP